MNPIGHHLRRFALALAVLASGTAGADQPGAVLQERQLREVKLDPAPLRMAECPTAGELEPGTVVAVCRAPGPRGEAGELHLMIVDRSGGRDKVLYRGPGVGDSYYMRPTVFDGASVVLPRAISYERCLSAFAVLPAPSPMLERMLTLARSN